MRCWWCGKELDRYKGDYYERWSLAMPAHLVGYLCVKCYDKKYSVRIKKFLIRLWKKIKKGLTKC